MADVRFPVELNPKSSGLKDTDKLLLGNVDDSNYAYYVLLSVLRAYMAFIDTDSTTSTDGEIVLFAGTDAKKIKRSQKTLVSTLSGSTSEVPDCKAVKDVTDLKANSADVYSKVEADAIFISKADNDNVVDLTSDQSITGEKTFVNGANIGNVSNDEIQQLNGVTSNVQSQLNAKIESSEKGSALGVAELDSNGLVPNSQLPSYVDDVIEVADYASLPLTGETGKIYVTLDDNLTYRWSGTVYVEISKSLALGETSGTAYRGDRGKTAYDHSQIVTGNPHGTAKEDIQGLQTDDSPEFADVIIDGLASGNVIDDESVENSLEAIDENLAYKSAGCITMFPFTDNGDGSITTVAHDVALFDNATFIGVPKKYTLAGGTFALVDGQTNYIVADYNGGTPIQKLISDVNLITESSVTPMYTIVRTGTVLHSIDWDSLGKGLSNKIHQSIVKTQRYRRESGLALSELGTRNIKLTAGKVWVGANGINLDEILSATDNIRFYKHVAGVWTVDFSITQYNNTQYDNGTDLVTLTNNRYAVNWLYRGVESQKHLYMVLGTGDYTLSDAQLSQPPAIPSTISSHAVLVGRIIVLKSASTATQINSAFDTTFNQASITDHNNLSNLQGGTTNEYYHLTAQQLADISNRVTRNLIENGNFINNSSNGYGYTTGAKCSDLWSDYQGNSIQGGFPQFTKQNLIDLTGVTDAQIEGLWNLNEISGVAVDLSANAYNLTDSNMSTTNGVSLMNYVRSMNGVNAYFGGITAVNANITTAQTWFGFVRTSAIGANQCIASFGASGNQRHLRISTTGEIVAQHTGATFNSNSSTIKLEANRWYFVAWCYDGNTSDIYVNGIKATSNVGAIPAISSNFAIGRREQYNDMYFSGQIQNFGIVSAYLSESQIKQIWTATNYKGIKLQRLSGLDATVYQSLNVDFQSVANNSLRKTELIQRLAGKTITMVAKMWQETANTGRLNINITGANNLSTVIATTGAWVIVSKTVTLPTVLRDINPQLRVENTNSNVWFKDVILYEGNIETTGWLPAPEDWAKFPRLLRLNIPKVINGYSFEENRNYTYSGAILDGYSVNPTVGICSFKISGDQCYVTHLESTDGTSNLSESNIQAPVVISDNMPGNISIGASQIKDNGTWQTSPGCVYTPASGAKDRIRILKDFAGGSFTTSGAKRVAGFMVNYLID